MIAYRRTRNIGEYVSRTKLPTDATTCPSEIQPYSQQIDFPISRCKHQQCGTCNMLRRRNFKEIKSTVTKEKFQITDRMTCATIRVIYVIECEKCNLQYVGQTNKSLRQRMAKHREALRAGKLKPRRIYKRT